MNVVFFQWSPDENYEGTVVFKGKISREEDMNWENIGEAYVRVITKRQEVTDTTTDRTYYPETVTEDQATSFKDVVESTKFEETLTITRETTTENLKAKEELSFEDSELENSSPNYSPIITNQSLSTSAFLFSDPFLSNITNYNISDSEAEPYQRLEAEYGGWGHKNEASNIKITYFIQCIMLLFIK